MFVFRLHPVVVIAAKSGEFSGKYPDNVAIVHKTGPKRAVFLRHS